MRGEARFPIVGSLVWTDGIPHADRIGWIQRRNNTVFIDLDPFPGLWLSEKEAL
jgi:hypothetical protein